jgi:hypothetical protein
MPQTGSRRRIVVPLGAAIVLLAYAALPVSALVADTCHSLFHLLEAEEAADSEPHAHVDEDGMVTYVHTHHGAEHQHAHSDLVDALLLATDSYRDELTDPDAARSPDATLSRHVPTASATAVPVHPYVLQCEDDEVSTFPDPVSLPPDPPPRA